MKNAATIDVFHACAMIGDARTNRKCHIFAKTSVYHLTIWAVRNRKENENEIFVSLDVVSLLTKKEVNKTPHQKKLKFHSRILQNFQHSQHTLWNYEH